MGRRVTPSSSHIKRDSLPSRVAGGCAPWATGCVPCLVAAPSIATGHHATIYAMTLLDVINLNSEHGNVTVFVCPRYVAKLMLDTQRDVGSGEARALQAIPS